MKNMNKLWIISIVAIIISLFFYRMLTVDKSGLVLEKCQIERYLTTTVDFFLTDDLKNEYSEDVITERLRRYISRSNKILTNSCLPIIREMGDVKFIDISNISLKELRSLRSNPIDLANVAKEILHSIGRDKIIEQYHVLPDRYFAIVFGKKYGVKTGNLVGSVNPMISNSMVVLDFNSKDHFLEHELGHLAGALHKNSDIKFARRQLSFSTSIDENFIKDYTGGYSCSSKSTIMYNAGSNIDFDGVIDIYSSPKATYNGKPCGDYEKGDNQRVITEYVKRIFLELDD